MHSQLTVGACCVCICFICLLKVNNLQVFCFFGACVSVLPWDRRVLLDFLCCPINHSSSSSLLKKFHQLYLLGKILKSASDEQILLNVLACIKRVYIYTPVQCHVIC